jgi:hypothetical protein
MLFEKLSQVEVWLPQSHSYGIGFVQDLLNDWVFISYSGICYTSDEAKPPGSNYHRLIYLSNAV